MSRPAELKKVENINDYDHIINIMADYCFGLIDEDKYQQIVKEYGESNGVESVAALEKVKAAFEKAIELGLTLELSTNPTKKTAEIWGAVEEWAKSQGLTE